VCDDLELNRPALHEVFAADGYAGRLGAELLEWTGGWSRVALRIDGDHRNFAGLLHGGVTFGVGDLAFAVASNSWGRVSVAMSVDVHFLATAEVGEVLVAEATERHRSRRTGAYLIEVRAGDSREEASTDGRLVGSLHALVHRTGRWHLGEDAWSRPWREAH